MEKLIRDGRTLYNLHVRKIAKLYNDEPCNKFYLNVQPDYGGGITDVEAEQYATEIEKAVNSYDELKQENERLKAEREELLQALKYARGRIEYDNPNHLSDYCKNVLFQVQNAINNAEANNTTV